MLHKLSVFIIIAIILTACVLRFFYLDKAPYGYHVDEYSGSVAVKCIATEGVDAHLIPHPLFFDVHYGTPKPPVWGYPAALWMKIFGYKADRLRAFTAFAHTIGLIGLFFLARLLFSKTCGLLAVLIGAISPWSFSLSRIGYESTFTVVFCCWGLFFFLRSNKLLDKSLAGLFLSAALYAYPPTRAFLPLMLPGLILLDIKRQRCRAGALCAFFLCLALPSIPLVQKTLSGEVQGRFNSISITAPDYLKAIHKTNSIPDLLQVFAANYATHFTQEFLFLKGDPSYVHSTRHFGIFGWLDWLGFAALFTAVIIGLITQSNNLKKDAWLLAFLAFNFFLSIVPAGLTNSELPNSLRIINGWPFTCLLGAYGLWRLSQYTSWILLITALIGALFAKSYLTVYFTVYPQEGKGMFFFWTKEEGEAARTEQDWLRFMVHYVHDDYHMRYYLMNYHGDSCTESRKKWESLWNYMAARQLL